MMALIYQLTGLSLTHVRRMRSPCAARIERRLRDESCLIVSVAGGSTGGRTFRGAIWARDHASPSNLAPRRAPAQHASTRVVRALSRRGRGERFRLAYTLTCCAGRPLGSSSQPPLSKWVEWTYVHMPQRFAL